jgi:hypothetical protein
MNGISTSPRNVSATPPLRKARVLLGEGPSPRWRCGWQRRPNITPRRLISLRSVDRQLVACDRQGLQRIAFELLEQVAAGNGLATKAAVVDQRELLGYGGVQFGE